MSPSDVNVILVRLEALHEDVVEVKEQVKATNGRVTGLEKFQARVEGAQAALSWRVPLVTGVVCTALGAGLAYLLG